MAVKAYVLIEVSIGRIPEVAANIRELPGVVEVDIVAGPYDIIAVVEGESPESVGRLVMQSLRVTPGVNYTLTCVAVSE